MLGEHLVFPILLSRDLDRSLAFYHGILGLEVARRDEDRIVFRCGAGTQIAVTLSTVGTRDSQTQLAWRVPDLHGALDDLRARGVRIESYVAPDPVTDADGIADMGHSWAAWIIDPDGNVLGIVEPKPAPTS
jgi:catechol 2,3-dioxygenase-like lactoylglutathione lyase family enzyme